MANKKNKSKKKPNAASQHNEQSDRPAPRRRQSWWNKTSNTNKIIIGVTVLGTLVGVGAIIVNELQHRRENRPRIVFVGQPKLIDPLTCDTSTGTFNAGKSNFSIRNLGKSQASDVVVLPISSRLVPGKKTGNKFVDEMTRITDQHCGITLKQPPAGEPNIGMPIAPETTMTFNVGGSSGKGPALGKDTPVQFYQALCAYYADEHGKPYGTCNTFRLVLPSGESTFLCGLPIHGRFTRDVIGHCAN